MTTDDQPVVLDALNEFCDLLRDLRARMTPDERRRAAALVASLVNDALEADE